MIETAIALHVAKVILVAIIVGNHNISHATDTLEEKAQHITQTEPKPRHYHREAKRNKMKTAINKKEKNKEKNAIFSEQPKLPQIASRDHSGL